MILLGNQAALQLNKLTNNEANLLFIPNCSCVGVKGIYESQGGQIYSLALHPCS